MHVGEHTARLRNRTRLTRSSTTHAQSQGYIDAPDTPSTEFGEGYMLTTENALTLFGIFVGVGNAVAQFISSARVSRIQGDEVPIRDFAPGIAVSALGLIGGALLIPDSV